MGLDGSQLLPALATYGSRCLVLSGEDVLMAVQLVQTQDVQPCEMQSNNMKSMEPMDTVYLVSNSEHFKWEKLHLFSDPERTRKYRLDSSDYRIIGCETYF